MLPIFLVVTSTWVLVAVVASSNNAVALEAYLHILRISDSWFAQVLFNVNTERWKICYQVSNISSEVMMLVIIAAQPIRNMVSFAECEVYKRFCTKFSSTIYCLF